jgi:hypothetical protein
MVSLWQSQVNLYRDQLGLVSEKCAVKVGTA